MPLVGFHASHEQLPPSALLDAVVHAEQAGFEAAMCSDHLEPWSVRQGHSGYAWSWLAAALEATRFSLGVVTAPGQRYHPAVAAQKLATLAEMYPGRFWAAIGSGEAINEHVTGDPWPDKDERDARLAATVDVIRRLLAGEEVSTDGPTEAKDLDKTALLVACVDALAELGPDEGSKPILEILNRGLKAKEPSETGPPPTAVESTQNSGWMMTSLLPPVSRTSRIVQPTQRTIVKRLLLPLPVTGAR